MEIVAVVIILVATGFDALRDAWMRSASWWKRHAVKWISFYLPLAWILYREVPFPQSILVVIGSWVVWRCSLRYIAGVKWESMWVRWFKQLFKIEKDQ